MIWEKSNRFDRRAREIADRHYNRQKPGTPQFVPPGRCCVLYAENERGSASATRVYRQGGNAAT